MDTTGNHLDKNSDIYIEDNLYLHKIVNIEVLSYCLHKFNESTSVSISERVGDLYIYADKLYKNALNYCAVRNQDIVGFISFYANNISSAYISNLAVDEKHKGCGIGSKLVNHAISIAKSKGISSMRLEVNRLNIEGVSFYTAKGFKPEDSGNDTSGFMVKGI